jgi:hypothetical protein
MIDRRHLLERLVLPARYERLEHRVGADLVKLLAAPERSLDSLTRVGAAIRKSGEGAFIPMVGSTGVGKTTLANNLGYFLPALFAPTMPYQGAISYDALTDGVNRLRAAGNVNGRILPISVDHREGAPPSDEELSAIKRFLRTTEAPMLLLWLETDHDIARRISDKHIRLTGKAAVDIPLLAEGPPPDTWQQIALHTLELCNNIPAGEIAEIGIDPHSYRPETFPTLGEFLKRISTDFANLLVDHQASSSRPIALVIAYVSGSLDRGVLSELTHGEPGLLNSHALLRCTPDSMIGRWWADRRGALTQTIYRLDARAFWFPPAAGAAVLRRHGPQPVVEILEGLGRSALSPMELNDYLERTDLGRYLAGSDRTMTETRGRPAQEAQAALSAVAKHFGYGGARDKLLNGAVLEALRAFIPTLGLKLGAYANEQGLPFCTALIPDNQLDLDDRVLCIEYCWRSGEALASSRRSEAAQYALDKLRNYAVNLGWVAP